MITRLTGRLTELHADLAILSIGAFDFEVLIPEFVRRQLQGKVGAEISLRTFVYLDGNPQQGKLVPRAIGFLSLAERDFFDAICSVDGVGVKKALRAMNRPVRDVAVAIEEQDLKLLGTLPGIGPALAERIVAKLRRKMAKFALMVSRESLADSAPMPTALAEAYEALLAIGHSAIEARQMIDGLASAAKKFGSVDEVLTALYQRQKS